MGNPGGHGSRDFIIFFQVVQAQLVMSLIELIRELQKIEKILKGKKDIHKVVKGSLGSFS